MGLGLCGIPSQDGTQDSDCATLIARPWRARGCALKPRCLRGTESAPPRQSESVTNYPSPSSSIRVRHQSSESVAIDPSPSPAFRGGAIRVALEAATRAAVRRRCVAGQFRRRRRPLLRTVVRSGPSCVAIRVRKFASMDCDWCCDRLRTAAPPSATGGAPAVCYGRRRRRLLRTAPPPSATGGGAAVCYGRRHRRLLRTAVRSGTI